MPSRRLSLSVALLLIVAALVFLLRPSGRPPAAAAPPVAETTSRPAPGERPPADTGAPAGDRGAVRREWLERIAYAQSWYDALPPAMAAFRDWTERHRGAPSPAARASMVAEGIALARARRAEMRRMIVTDPQRALAVTVPAVIRQQLPAAVLAELETRHAGRGDYALQAAQFEPGTQGREASLRRTVYLGGVTYSARSYGRREEQLSKEGASLHGIALDGEFALHENPVRLLEPGEIPADPIEPGCAACAQALAPVQPATAVNRDALEVLVVDGRLRRVHENELGALVSRALRAEEGSNPRVKPLSQGPSSDAGSPPRAGDAPTPHTIGTKQVLVIRVDFSDVSGEPLSQAAAQTVVDGAVKTFMEDISYGQTTVVATVSAELYRMPRTASSYATAADNNGLHTDARNAAAAHFTIANYDRVIVVFPNISTGRVPGSRITYAGLGNVAGSNAWINGPTAFVLTTVSHELGHTYGVLHGNLWRVTDRNPLSADGNTLEYGDPFDMMGSTSATGVLRDARHHFSMWAKNRLGWLPDGAVNTVRSSGTYRIHRFDSRNSPRQQPLALRIYRDGVRWYWVGLRQNFSAGTPRADGAYVIWGHNQRLQTQLLDLNTPGTSANDAVLTIGSTFNDAAYGITIRPIARGGDEPAQWLDVEVTVPPTPPNLVTAWGREGATFYNTETGEDILPAPETNVPMTLTHVQAIAGGDQHALALKSDGTVVAWGDHINGQIAVPAGLSGVVAIAAGADVSGAVLADGSVRVWGDPANPVLTLPAGLSDVRQLAFGRNHALALKNDGTVVAWGNNSAGQINVPAGLADVTAVTAGTEISVALKLDGTVSAWGVSFGRAVPAGLNNVTAISSFGALQGGQFVAALKSDGTVVAWGVNNNNQTVVPAGLNEVVAISAGAFHTLALRSDGSVVVWGVLTGGRGAVPPSMPRCVAVAATSGASLALTGANFRITEQPVAQASYVQGGATFRVGVGGTGPFTYQWRKDGVAIPGATSATYTLASAAAGDAGLYSVVVTAAGVSLPSAGARLTVDAVAPEVSRIANLSIRTSAATGANTLIVGFSVNGSGAKPLLIRGVGPTLAAFGVDGTLADPKVDLFNGAQARIQGNDNWNATDASTFASVGAFPLTPGSRDAALFVPALETGTYSAQLSGADANAGIVLAEIYDASPGGASFTDARPRLVNVSARTFSGTGANTLIAGFVIAGPAPRRVLIRAIGPTLGVFGVTGVLTDPRLELFDRTNTRIRDNDNWGGGTALEAAFRSVGAFALEAGSRDAAVLAQLDPGSYTAQVSGVAGATGVALVEIYEVP